MNLVVGPDRDDGIRGSGCNGASESADGEIDRTDVRFKSSDDICKDARCFICSVA